MDSLSDKHINSLIAGKILGILNSKEEEELARWLSESEANKELYERVSSDDYRNERGLFIENLQMDAHWSYVKKTISSRTSIKYLTRFGMVASILIFLVAGWLWAYFHEYSDNVELVQVAEPVPGSSKALLITGDGQQIVLQDTSLRIALNAATHLISDGKHVGYSEDSAVVDVADEMNTIVVPRGGEYEVILSDNTSIYLNADSKLRYPVNFKGDKRVVELDGEAYFKVSKDKNRPFIVRVNNQMDVEVVGTEFNITAYPEESVITTTLNKGMVKLITPERHEYLRPNEQILYSKDNFEMKKIQVEGWIYSAWTEGRIVLRNVSLEDLMVKLSRWYDLKIIWKNDQIKKFHFSGEILRYDNFSEILEMLEKATYVDFDVVGNQISIRKR